MKRFSGRTLWLCLVVCAFAVAQAVSQVGQPGSTAPPGRFTGPITATSLTVSGNITSTTGAVVAATDVSGATITGTTLTGHLLDPNFETPVNAVAATATMTYTVTDPAPLVAALKAITYTDANLPAGNDTVIISDGVTPKTYKFVASVAVEGDVLIGTADATALNLVQALNATGGTNEIGGDYLVAAENPLVSAAQDTTGAGTGTITLTARTAGADGNDITADGTFAGTAFFPDSQLESGTDAEQIVLGAVTYTFVVAVAEDYDVKIGANADASAANLEDAIAMTEAPGVGDNDVAGLYKVPIANAAATATLDNSGDGGSFALVAKTKGVAGNSIVLTAAQDQYAVTDAFSNTPTGVDGTVGAKGQVLFGTGYIYLCTAANGISGANWKRAEIAAY